MDIRDLRFFYLESFAAVAKHRSFTAAAVALGVSKGGISKAVTEYETQLGFPLFSRTTRHVEITPAGAELLPSIRAILRFTEVRHCAAMRTAHHKASPQGGSTNEDLQAHLHDLETRVA